MCDVKTGVELEVWVVDSRGDLTDGQAIVDAVDQIKPEFIDPLIEVQTEPHDCEPALRRDLETTLRDGMRVADRNNKHLVPMGTPLTASDEQANCKRGKLFETIYGAGVQSAKNCAGTHVHFQKGNVVDQLNVLTALDPALALVSSSPYYCGDNGAASSRAGAYRGKCGAAFRRFCELWPYADSLQEWRGRVDHVYDRFKELAADCGVSADTVDGVFEPENTVLNPVRLRECQPTVEWRAPDAALPSEVIDLAIDVGTLVSETDTKAIEYGSPGVHADRIELPEFATLQELSQSAILSGLESTTVESYLKKMGFAPSTYDPISPRLNGPATLSESEARTLRLQQSDRLQDDLKAIAV